MDISDLLIALRKFTLLYKQLFDFIHRASVMACNALNEVGYILGELWDGGREHTLLWCVRNALEDVAFVA